MRVTQEALRRAAEEARETASQAREILMELTDLTRRMRVATEAQEAIVNDLHQRTDPPPG